MAPVKLWRVLSVRPGQIVRPGDEACVAARIRRNQCGGQGQVFVEGTYIMGDAHGTIFQRRFQPLTQVIHLRPKSWRDLSYVESCFDLENIGMRRTEERIGPDFYAVIKT